MLPVIAGRYAVLFVVPARRNSVYALCISAAAGGRPSGRCHRSSLAELGDMQSLLTLHVANNRLVSLPSSLSQLQRLRLLSASGNRMEGLPDLVRSKPNQVVTLSWAVDSFLYELQMRMRTAIAHCANRLCACELWMRVPEIVCEKELFAIGRLGGCFPGFGHRLALCLLVRGVSSAAANARARFSWTVFHTTCAISCFASLPPTPETKQQHDRVHCRSCKSCTSTTTCSPTRTTLSPLLTR